MKRKSKSDKPVEKKLDKIVDKMIDKIVVKKVPPPAINDIVSIDTGVTTGVVLQSIQLPQNNQY